MITADLGKPLAIGRTAELYAWESSQVLKLFFDWFDLDRIQYEQHMAQTVHASGLPVPSAGKILQVNGRNGLLYERIFGKNLWEVFEKQPWRVFSLARQTAQIHVEIHANKRKPDLPPQRRRLENKLRSANSLSISFRQSFLSRLSSMPEGDSICHGDFHPGNLLLTPSQVVVIDWIDASHGNPLADVARTTVLILGATASSQIPNYMMKILFHLFHAIYLRHYFQLRPGGEEEYHRWLPIVAAARLSENIPELERWLVQRAEHLM